GKDGKADTRFCSSTWFHDKQQHLHCIDELGSKQDSSKDFLDNGCHKAGPTYHQLRSPPQLNY
ncbi:unnamed protein product, partial [Allacma fusca]